MVEHDRHNLAVVPGKRLASVRLNAVGTRTHTVHKQPRLFVGETTEVEGAPQGSKIKAPPLERDQHKVGSLSRNIPGIVGFTRCVDDNEVRLVRAQIRQELFETGWGYGDGFGRAASLIGP